MSYLKFLHRIRVLLCIVTLVVGGIAASPGLASADERGPRPLLLILLQPNPFVQQIPGPPPQPLAHSEAWYEDRIFGSTGLVRSRNVADYFSESSRGQFTFSKADTVTVLEDTSIAFETAAGVKPSDKLEVKTTKRVRLLAANAGFEYSKYDANGDGSVTTDELTILAIDGYTSGNGVTRFPGCLPMSGVKVCSGVSLAGHTSDLMMYAHELSHLLSPISVDLYGAYRSYGYCLSPSLTLLSCNPVLDGVAGYFMDPWHRMRYGWNGTDRTIALSGSGSQVIAPVGYDVPGFVETLSLQGSNNEAIVFESRLRSSNPYEDGLAAEGLLAWFQQTDSSGEPLNIPSLANPEGDDKSIFVLAPVDCELDPNNVQSRGKVGPLGAAETFGGSTYRLKWSDGSDSRYLIRVEPLWGLFHTVSWSASGAEPYCGAGFPPIVPPLLPPLPPLPRFACVLLPLLCNPCGPYGLCLPPGS